MMMFIDNSQEVDLFIHKCLPLLNATCALWSSSDVDVW